MNYPVVKGVCFKVIPNGNMGGNEIHIPPNNIALIDRTGTVKEGDIIECHYNDKGFYSEVFVNSIKRIDLLH